MALPAYETMCSMVSRTSTTKLTGRQPVCCQQLPCFWTHSLECACLTCRLARAVAPKASMVIDAACVWVQCRVESQHVVTASNLFKYCEPCHGLVLFKHHDPLTFSQQQLSELLEGSQEWMLRAGSAHPAAHHPFFLWNCLHRAGASQYHGHAQVMLSSVRSSCLSLPDTPRLNFQCVMMMLTPHAEAMTGARQISAQSC